MDSGHLPTEQSMTLVQNSHTCLFPRFCRSWLGLFVLIDIIAVALVKPACAQQGGAEAPADPLRVMSFNIRYANQGDGPDRWEARRDFLAQTVRHFDPDLLGTQETLAAQADDLCERLSDYAFVGAGRDDGERKGEMTAVFFRRDRLELVDSGHFWLSETPDVPGSKNWDAAITRMVTWLVLRDRSRREFAWFNTHFDHVGQEARLQSAKLLGRRVAARGDLPVVVTGDFNAPPASPPYEALLASDGGCQLFDGYRAAHPKISPDEATYHGFAGATRGERIDWILHSRHFQTKDASIDRTSQNGRYPSDHFAVTAVLDWPKESR